ncbi:MAG: hypothetical protein WC764_00410 [Candidatus Paceibacterota bacterium]
MIVYAYHNSRDAENPNLDIIIGGTRVATTLADFSGALEQAEAETQEHKLSKMPTEVTTPPNYRGEMYVGMESDYVYLRTFSEGINQDDVSVLFEQLRLAIGLAVFSA